MAVAVETLNFGPNGGIPNHPDLPAVLVRGALRAPSVGAAKAAFAANGWGGLWDWTVYDYHHFHPDAHEALAVVKGRATLALGGPEGAEVTVQAGDLVVLPAGFGHRRVSASDGFGVVGGYPPGQEGPAILRAGDMDIAEALAQVAEVPRPETDPLGSAALLEAWARG